MFGVQVHFSPYATTMVRNFPVSKHRSRRVYKKLVKRFGGELRQEPAIFKTPNGIVAHPSLKAAIIAATGNQDAII